MNTFLWWDFRLTNAEGFRPYNTCQCQINLLPMPIQFIHCQLSANIYSLPMPIQFIHCQLSANIYSLPMPIQFIHCQLSANFPYSLSIVCITAKSKIPCQFFFFFVVFSLSNLSVGVQLPPLFPFSYCSSCFFLFPFYFRAEGALQKNYRRYPY